MPSKEVASNNAEKIVLQIIFIYLGEAGCVRSVATSYRELARHSEVTCELQKCVCIRLLVSWV